MVFARENDGIQHMQQATAKTAIGHARQQLEYIVQGWLDVGQKLLEIERAVIQHCDRMQSSMPCQSR